MHVHIHICMYVFHLAVFKLLIPGLKATAIIVNTQVNDNETLFK